MMIMQVTLDYRSHRNLFRWVDDIGDNALTWAGIFAVVSVLLIMLITRKRK